MSTVSQTRPALPAAWPAGATTAIGIGLLLLAEVLVATTLFDGASLQGRPGLPGQIGSSGAWILRFGVGFLAAFAAFAGLEGRLQFRRLFDQTGSLRWNWMALHAVSAAAFGVLSAALYDNWPGVSSPELLSLAWILAACATIASVALAYAPFQLWKTLLTQSGSAPWLAVVVSGLGISAVRLSQSMWQSTADLTFKLVQLLLHPIIPTLTADPVRRLIRGRQFGVLISQECSGLEGIGLMLIFSLAWLWLYRREFRFPRAYLLIPAGVVTLYLLNAVRIAALLLIGDAGAREIAAGGFHSQAGWIAFNGVALGMTLLVPRLPWFMLHPRQSAVRVHQQHDNPTAAYLIPFLAILATGMLTRAVSANFDWLYSARIIAVAVALWIFRDRLRTLDWRFGWIGTLAGLATFGLWLAFDQWQAIPAAAMPAPLAAADSTTRTLWIVFRALAAIVTVPIAEELAFRGFALRRLSNPDFESVFFSRTTWLPILASSIAFGLLHGERWLAGILAGLIFALAARVSNRLGDAVFAHALTNALLAVWVLYSGQWQYW